MHARRGDTHVPRQLFRPLDGPALAAQREPGRRVRDAARDRGEPHRGPERLFPGGRPLHVEQGGEEDTCSHPVLARLCKLAATAQGRRSGGDRWAHLEDGYVCIKATLNLQKGSSLS